MDKNVVVTAFRRDESEALFRIVPFDGALALRMGTGLGDRTAISSGAVRVLVADGENLGDLRTARTLLYCDRQTRAVGKLPAACCLQDPNVQVSVGSIRELDEPKTLAGIEPEHLGVDRAWNDARRLLIVGRLENRTGKR